MHERWAIGAVLTGLVLCAACAAGSGTGGDDADVPATSTGDPDPVAEVACTDAPAPEPVPTPNLPDGIPLPAEAVVTSDVFGAERVVTGTVAGDAAGAADAYRSLYAERQAVTLGASDKSGDDGATVRIAIEGPSARGEITFTTCDPADTAFEIRLRPAGSR